MVQHTYSIDTETYYDAVVSAETLGPWMYHRHPDTAAYLVAIAGTDGTRYCGDPAAAPWGAIAGGVWVSHNAAFDQLAYLRLGASGGGPAEWHCTADLAAYLQAPRNLAGACRELMGVSVDKSARDRMKGVRWSDLNEIGRAEMREYGQRDADLCLQLWTRYADQWPDRERRLSEHGRRMMMAGLPVNRQKIVDGVASLQRAVDAVLAGIPWVAEGKKPLSRDPFDAYCTEQGLPIPDSMAKNDDDFAEWLDKYSEDHPVVGHLRTFRSANAFLKKAETLRDWTDETGVFRVSLLYCGADATLRWTGKQGDGNDKNKRGFNPQNLPRAPVYGMDFRGSIQAPPGYTFVIADLGQIEPRAHDWLTDDTASLELLRAGWHPYEAHGKQIGYDVNPGLFKKQNPLGYNVSKAQRIALGYRMGPERYIKAAILYTDGKYHPTFAQALKDVRSFRKSKPLIVNMWTALERQMTDSIGGDFVMELPSGNKVRYFDVRRGRYGLEARVIRGGRFYTWHGGILTENLVQATARDIFAEVLLRLEDAGVDVRLHVHDEAVALCRVDEAAEVARVMERCMTTPPDWMADLPLGCEVNVTEVYCK